MQIIPYLVLTILVLSLLPLLLWAIWIVIYAFFGDLILRQHRINEIKKRWKK